MSLFREIRRLSISDKEQVEDVLTEIVAAVLCNSQELTKSWLQMVGVCFAPEAEIISIKTQYRVPGLPEHDTSSRIDMVIRLAEGDSRYLVYIESKVGSHENTRGEAQTSDYDPVKVSKGQLQTYTELLAEECRQQKATGSLIFITRDYEFIDHSSFKNSTVHFYQTRWFQFFQHLKSRKSSDGLESQLKLFLKENRMSIGNQFRSTDLVALENFHGAKALMDETLEEVSDRWRKVLGKGGWKHKAIGQLRRHGRYMIETKFPGFEALLGYWLPQDNPDESVSLGIVFYCNPKAEQRDAILSAFREWASKRGDAWDVSGMDDPKSWAELTRWQWLRNLQTSEDHVAAVKNYFAELVTELEAFKSEFPKLPWTPADTKDEEEE